VPAHALVIAATTPVAFTFLTMMHERYDYAAFVFLLFLLPVAAADRYGEETAVSGPAAGVNGRSAPAAP